jgi:hypothetical protein
MQRFIQPLAGSLVLLQFRGQNHVAHGIALPAGRGSSQVKIQLMLLEIQHSVAGGGLARQHGRQAGLLKLDLTPVKLRTAGSQGQEGHQYRDNAPDHHGANPISRFMLFIGWLNSRLILALPDTPFGAT